MGTGRHSERQPEGDDSRAYDFIAQIDARKAIKRGGGAGHTHQSEDAQRHLGLRCSSVQPSFGFKALSLDRATSRSHDECSRRNIHQWAKD